MAGSCSKCGLPLGADAKFCAACGKVVPDGATRTLFEFAPPTSVEPKRDAPKADLAATVLDPTRPEVPVIEAPSSAPETVPRDTTVTSSLATTLARPSTPEPALAPPRPAAAKTMLGVAAPDLRIPLMPPAAGAPPAPATAPTATTATLTGPDPALTAPQPAGPAPANPPQSGAGRAAIAKTMLGVAIPGIAPTAPGQPAPVPPKASGTILGVAMPGIAPLQPGVNRPAPQPPQRVVLPAPPLEPIVPRPAPLVDDEPMPAAPQRAKRSGLPLAAVAGSLAGLVLVTGIVVALVWKGTPPIIARPTLDAQGHEALHLSCDACADGTGVDLSGSKTAFKNKEADLLLSSPLQIGQNPFNLRITRPGIGRDETVKIVVPVSFRIRADMAGVSAKPPVITVRVAAAPDTEVEVDGKPIAIDAQGSGAYTVDIGAETQGTSVETKRIERKIPYKVTHKGEAPVTGTLPVGIGVTPLQLEAPGMHAVTDQKTFLVAGLTTPGATVTINGEAAHVEGSGAFARALDAPAAGQIEVDVVAGAPQLAARTVHFAVRRVDSLDAEARALESLSSSLLTYDAAADISAHVGQAIVVEGEIIETRFADHQTILVVTDRRGCAKKADPNQCLARVLFGGEDKRKKGESVRVFGHITRAVQAQNGRAVPEIEADFLVKPRGG